MVRVRNLHRVIFSLSMATLFLHASLLVQAQSLPGAPPSAMASEQAAARPAAARVDWSKAVVESTMKRYPTATELGSWGYGYAKNYGK